MRKRVVKKLRCATAMAAGLLWCVGTYASAIHGKVVFGGRELPGVQITVRNGEKTESAITDSTGAFRFVDLADGTWKIEAIMQCFESLHADVDVNAAAAPLQLEMKLLPAEKLAQLAQSATSSGRNLQEQQALAKPADSVSMAADPLLDASTQSKIAPSQVSKSKPGAPNGSTNSNGQSTSLKQQAQQIPPAQPHEENEQGSDGFLVQGSVNNAATSSFSTNAAFGNMRFGQHSLYTGGLQVTFDNSALDAQPYALSGVSAARQSFNNTWGTANVSGPLKLRFIPHGPSVTLRYNWSRRTSAQTLDGLVPTPEERVGDLAGLTNAQGQAITIYDPKSGAEIKNKIVQVDPVAAALLKLYPLPNLAGSSKYNYQAQTLSSSRSDSVNLSFNERTKHAGGFYEYFGVGRSNSESTNLIGFLDHTNAPNTYAGIGWNDWFQHLGMYANAHYQFTGTRETHTPYFANRTNISGDAGIKNGSNGELGGNDQTPANWGPPSLGFTSGFSGLNDADSSNNRTRTDDVSFELGKWKTIYSIKLGSELKKLEFNYNGQQDPRGAFTFTGTATAGANAAAGTTSGSDFADFLLGIPDTSRIAYGNADKYLRQTEYNLYLVDDWRLLPNLSINLGLRWEYSASMTELFGRLVNLDVASGFSAVNSVVAYNPVGSLTGTHYPDSLIKPDRSMIEPRVGLSWRPLPSSSLVIRAGYGKYTNTSVYRSIAEQMMQQAPLSTSLQVQNGASCPLTLASGFVSCAATTNYNFGIDPNFRIGYAQTWNLQVQHDLPLALQVSAKYLGTKGTHGAQEILPNSYAPGAENPCPTCQIGFAYESSGGNSMRHAGELILKRRMPSGLGATVDYIFSKSIDDDSPGAVTIAQNWRNPRAERSLSSFDQRHLLKLQMQYTTGMGLGGGTLLDGWRGRALKEWTLLTTLNTGSGLPETPIYPAVVPGTGFFGILRPSLTGAPIYTHNAGAHLNAAAYTAPSVGLWGNAGRYSIAGPGQFSLDSSMARTFRAHKHASLDLKLVSTNLLNKVTYSSWNSSINSSQFGLPLPAKPMRSVQIEMNLRFEK